jgi:hypothetical protein
MIHAADPQGSVILMVIVAVVFGFLVAVVRVNPRARRLRQLTEQDLRRREMKKPSA